MNLIIAAVTAALLSAPHVPPPPKSTDAGDCSRAGWITGCNDLGGIDLNGQSSSAGAPPADGGGTNAPKAGDIKLVSCTSGLAGLTAAGDLTAPAEAAECADWIPACQAAGPTGDGTDVAYVRLILGADGRWRLNGDVCRPPATPVVTAAMVVGEARRLLPHLVVGMAPKAGSVTLVNMQTIFWVSTDVVRSLGTVPIIGQQVAITVTFDHTVWDFGDGSGATAGSPGKAYDPAGDACTTPLCADYFGHVYSQRASVTASATTWWKASFSVNGGPVQPIPGTVDGPVSTVTVSVAEARSVLVTDPPGR